MAGMIRCVGFDFRGGGVALLLTDGTVTAEGPRLARAELGKRHLEHAMGVVNQDQARALLELLAPALDKALASLQTEPDPAEPKRRRA
jgi:hypothetical protein